MAEENVKLKWSKGAGTVELCAGKLFVGSIIPLMTNFPQHSKLVFFDNNGKFENDNPIAQTTAVDENGNCEIDLRSEVLRPFFMVQPQGGSAIFTVYLYLADEATTAEIETDKSVVIAKGQITINYTPLTFRESKNGIVINTTAVSLKGEKGEKGDPGFSVMGPAAKLGYVKEPNENKWYPLSCERQQDGSLLLVVDDEETPESVVAPNPDGDVQNLRGIIETQNNHIESVLSENITDELSLLNVSLQNQNDTIATNKAEQDELIANSIEQQNESIASAKAEQDATLATQNANIASVNNSLSSLNSRIDRFNESMTDGITNGFIYPLCDDYRLFMDDASPFLQTYPKVGDSAIGGRINQTTISNSIITNNYIDDNARWEFEIGGVYYSRANWLSGGIGTSFRDAEFNPYNSTVLPFRSVKNRKNLLIRFAFGFQSRFTNRVYNLNVGYYNTETNEEVVFFNVPNAGEGTNNQKWYYTQVILDFNTGDNLPKFFVEARDVDETQTTWEYYKFTVQYGCYQYIPLI